MRGLLAEPGGGPRGGARGRRHWISPLTVTLWGGPSTSTIHAAGRQARPERLPAPVLRQSIGRGGSAHWVCAWVGMGGAGRRGTGGSALGLLGRSPLRVDGPCPASLPFLSPPLGGGGLWEDGGWWDEPTAGYPRKGVLPPARSHPDTFCKANPNPLPRRAGSSLTSLPAGNIFR